MKKVKSAEGTTATKNVQQVYKSNNYDLLVINEKLSALKDSLCVLNDEGHEKGFVIEFDKKNGVTINMSFSELGCVLPHLKWDKKINDSNLRTLMDNVWEGKIVFVAKHFDYEYDDVRDKGKYGCYFIYKIDEKDE